ncbi:type II secretion system major pseudopilin GspG [Sphingomonas sp. LY29]|uniref:type II secretion system major pseudopilin GspG n=1 Tax=Sphingomonas sp. LY29 TaxID=3095341 RepID=UPI002D7830FD|nr:type II secretion system major pseudopilin GspG [Sphingomonas sp. LY29]WRP26828.1 type II secretion system major pseudopilin GspG [Sphingomonas sp. LY29]
MLRTLLNRFANRPQRDEEDGFTLVELMVVIVIIGLLATVVMINVLPSQDRAMETKARADIATLEQAMEMYRLDNLTYPSGSDGLNALVTPPPSLAQSGRYRPGGYIKNVPQDPWGRPYQLTVPGKSGPFDIVSFGADGAPGGSDENADIRSEPAKG